MFIETESAEIGLEKHCVGYLDYFVGCESLWYSEETERRWSEKLSRNAIFSASVLSGFHSPALLSLFFSLTKLLGKPGPHYSKYWSSLGW